MKAIFATDLAHGFGINGRLPWKNKDDMAFFRDKTHWKHIVMGYNTWKTLPKLPYRTSVVISRSEIQYALCIPQNNHIKHIKDLESELNDEVMVIGGAKILTPELLDSCSSIYHTTIKGTFEADTFMSPDSMASLRNRKETILLDNPSCIIREYT
jgi:dihydrofolate reductase